MFLIHGFLITKTLYTSGSTVVFAATRESDTTPVILKTHSTEFPDKSLINRIYREFELLRLLNDVDGVIKTLGLLENTAVPVLVLEPFESVSLQSLLSYKTPGVDLFLDIAERIIPVLQKIHRAGIIHKDINPANILWREKDKELRIIDFDISRLLYSEGDKLTGSRFLEGTLPYISPEQTGRMSATIDYRTDFYSLGATFYQLLSGHTPFRANDDIEYIHSHIAKKPLPLNSLNKDIPELISKIVAKLLEKDPENRYQSCETLLFDIAECRQRRLNENWQEPYEIGYNDRHRKFSVPARLYGREQEIELLTQSFEMVRQGEKGLLLVGGNSGIGKSSLIREMQRSISAQSGFFVSGKFDQFRKDIPYYPIITALKSLIDQILSESEKTVLNWKMEFQKSLGNSGSVITDAIPELEYIIGKQEKMAQLPPSEAQNRFINAIKSFIKVITDTGIPLVMFFDDMQWSDYTTINLINFILRSRDIKNFLLICTYRDNELFPTHPFLQMVHSFSEADPLFVKNLELNPLNRESTGFLVQDVLGQNDDISSKIADFCFEKTNGSPFFLNQFIKSLYDNAIVYFDDKTDKWNVNIHKLNTLPVTENVVDFLVVKLRNQDGELQRLLRIASCIGNEFDLKTLSIIAKLDIAQTAMYMWKAIQNGFIKPRKGICDSAIINIAIDDENIPVYGFVHDGVFQAAYNEINDDEKHAIHAAIGNLMLIDLDEQERNERIFDILLHLNKGSVLVSDPAQRIDYAKLNLTAGKRAALSSAFQVALTYFETGIGLLCSDSWENHYSLCLELYSEAAIAANICTLDDKMENYSETVIAHALEKGDLLKVYEMKIQAYTSRNDPNKAIDTSLEVLNRFGIHFPRNPSKVQIITGYVKTRFFLTKKRQNNILLLKRCENPEILSILNIFLRMATAAYFVTPELQALLTFKRIEFSYRYGNSDATTTAYGGYAIVLSVFGKYSESYKFGKIALALLDKLGGSEYKARVFFYWGAFIRHWKEPLHLCLNNLLDSYQASLDNGDVDYMSYSAFSYTYSSLFCGKQLEILEKEADEYLAALGQYKQNYGLNVMCVYLQTIKTLLGKSDYCNKLKGEWFDEDEKLPFFLKKPDYSILAATSVCKIILAYFADDLAEALRSAEIFEKFKSGVKSSYNFPVFYFFDALVRARLCTKDPLQRHIHLGRLRKNLKLLRRWAFHCPENNLHKVYCIEAELARIEGRPAKASVLYDKAISYAKKHLFINDEAIASELTARFYFEQGQTRIGSIFMNDAYNAFNRWGVNIKCKALKEEYTQQLSMYSSQHKLDATNITNKSSVSEIKTDTFDVHSFLKASHAISRQILFEDLLINLMSILIENAAAQKGVLLLNRNGSLTIEAEATTDRDETRLLNGISLSDYGKLPLSIINYVWRTGEPLVINDENGKDRFLSDEYLKANSPKSILCSPLISKNTTIGIYYLENSLTPSLFTSDKLEILNLLSSQISISLENASLYKQMQEYNRTLEKKVEERTTELTDALTRIEQLAMTDPLTKLSNRRHIISCIEYQIVIKQRTAKPFCIVICDIDHFKNINDTYGHDCGDAVLLSVASVFKNVLRQQDFVSRWGGEEFLIVLPDTSIDGAQIVAEKLRSKIENTQIQQEDTTLSITMTFGVTVFSEAAGIDGSIIQADQALYFGKNSGRNKVVVFDLAAKGY
jgi:diguanylate cyclase (GGDEF)-like protein